MNYRLVFHLRSHDGDYDPTVLRYMAACSLTSVTTFRRNLPPLSRHVSHAVYLIMEATGYSEKSILYHTTRRHIPEEGCSGIGHSILPDPNPPPSHRISVSGCFLLHVTGHSKGKGKGKVPLRTGHEGPQGEQRYSSTLSLTSALDGVGGQRHAPAALTQGKTR
jgi:hypothetical protein